jgi:hypothetical protein
VASKKHLPVTRDLVPLLLEWPVVRAGFLLICDPEVV